MKMSIDRHKSEFVAGAAYNFLFMAFGAVFTFLFNLVLSNTIGDERIGVFFIFVVVTSIFATISRFGFEHSVMRFGSISFYNKNHAELEGLFRRTMIWVLVISSLMAALIMLVYGLVDFGNTFGALKPFLPWLIICIPPVAILPIFNSFFCCVGKSGKAAMVQSFLPPALYFTGAMILLWWGAVLLYNIVILYVLSMIISVLCGLLIWKSSVPSKLSRKPNFDNSLLLKTSAPLLLVSGAGLIMSWADTVVLGFFESPGLIGVYGISLRIALLSSFVLVAVNSVVAPRFSVLFRLGKLVEIRILAQKSAICGALLVLPLLLICLFFPRDILSLFGHNFDTGANCLQILAIGQFYNVAVGTLGNILIASGNEKFMQKIVITSAALNVLGNVLLIPPLGILGAAISTTVSMILLNSWMLVRVIKLVSVDLELRPKTS